jgi:cell division protein FtsA
MRCIGNATVKAASSIVSEDDIRRAVDEARKIGFGETFTPVVRIRQPYFLDGRMCPSPVGQMGKLLRASFWMIGAPAKQINSLVRIVGGLNFTVNEFIVSSAASGTVLARDSDREDGVLIVDIGAGATDYILYRRGAVLATGVLPVGGDHITHDLNIGLRVQSLKIAEKIKREHDPEVLKEDEAATVATQGDNPIVDKRVRVRAVETIITARLSEIFDIIKKRLLPHSERGKLRSGVILTGGTSQLRGINETAKRIFEMEVRQGELADWVPDVLALPQYSTVLGVLYEGWAQASKAHRPPPQTPPTPRPPKKRSSFLQTLRHILSQ